MKKILNKQIFYSFKIHLFIVLLLILTSAWGLFYYDFYQIAQSESGIFFYPSHTFEGNVNSWGSYFFGYRNSLSLPYFTFLFRFFFNSDFQYPFISQFGYYLLLFYLGFTGLYLLLDYLIGLKKTPILKLYLSTFVIFNPASLSVLLRFQYPLITFYYLLPLILYFSLRIFNSKSTREFLVYTVLINLLLSFFSIIYAAMPTLVLIIIVLAILSVFYLFKNFNMGYVYKIATFYIIWFLLNSFWLTPMVMEFAKPNSLYSSEYKNDVGNNLSTLQFFSTRDAGFINIFSLHTDEYSKNFFNDNLVLVWLFKIVNLIPVLFILYNLYKERTRLSLKSIKNSKLLVIIFLFLIFLIIIRGLNFPFSAIYGFIFQKIVPLQIFRNSFEKGILVFYLPFLILFIWSLVGLLNRNIKKTFLYAFIIVYFLTNSYLIYSSKLLLGDTAPFDNSEVGFKLDVPEEYKNISNTINTEIELKSHNTLVLPLVTEGISYKWENGYIGVDILHQILSNRAYSFISPDNYFERVSLLNNIYFAKNKGAILDMFNFKSVVLRDDYDFLSRSQSDPNILNNYFLNNFSFDKESPKDIKNYSVVVNSTKSRDLYKGNIYNPINGEVSIDYDRESFIYLYIVVKNEKDLPLDKPFALVVKSPDIKKIDDFEIIDSKKRVKDRLIFSNNEICTDCFITEFLVNSSSSPITSFTLKVYPKEKGTNIRIEKIQFGDFIKNISGPVNLTKLDSSLYSTKSSIKDINCFSKYETYSNISKFIYEDFYPDQFLYIKDSELPEKLKGKRLDSCDLNVDKNSNSEYTVEILPNKNKDKYNTILDFKNSADSYWRLLPEKWYLFDNLPFENTKFVSNTYTNSFFLENVPSEGVKFKLIYLPQLLFEIFKFVSAFSWFTLIIVTIYFLIKKNKQ